MTRTSEKKNTKSATEIFEILRNHEANHDRWYTTYANKHDNCTPITDIYGVCVAEKWSVDGGYDVWWYMKDECDIFNARFARKRTFRGDNAETACNEFLYELVTSTF